MVGINQEKLGILKINLKISTSKKSSFSDMMCNWAYWRVDIKQKLMVRYMYMHLRSSFIPFNLKNDFGCSLFINIIFSTVQLFETPSQLIVYYLSCLSPNEILNANPNQVLILRPTYIYCIEKAYIRYYFKQFRQWCIP